MLPMLPVRSFVRAVIELMVGHLAVGGQYDSIFPII